jgi:predicted Rossmann fold flavoprotein
MKEAQNVTLVFDIVVIGGGASGFFSALNLAVSRPNLKIVILERGSNVLTKVKISGGGRCNVTHAEFIPQDLVLNYPRGEKELLGPFHSFMTGDTIGWFEERGVQLKIEEDGRMFPVSDSSQTIIDCFLAEAAKYNVKILKEHVVKEFALTRCSPKGRESRKLDFAKADSEKSYPWKVITSKGIFKSKYLIAATGSNPKMWNLLEKLGHTITPAVPSLFTFNIKDKRIEGLMGLSTEAAVEVVGLNLQSEGPLLITHWGMSGPGILKLSAWGARELNDRGYNFKVKVNWLLHVVKEEALDQLNDLKYKYGKQSPYSYAHFELPKRLWKKLLEASGIQEELNWGDVSKSMLEQLSKELTEGIFQVNGKSTFKEEFVTAGGVELKEVNFKTFESKVLPNLFLAGEVLNIDAITGGFNFQNAWTGGYHIAEAIKNRES